MRLFIASLLLASVVVAPRAALADEAMLWLRCESAPADQASPNSVAATWRIGAESMVMFAGEPMEAGDEFCADRGPVTSWCTVGETEISYEASRGEERWDYVINRRTGRATLTHAVSGRRTTTTGTCAPIEDPQSGAKF